MTEATLTPDTTSQDTMPTDKAKRVIRYFNGERDIYGDPGRIQRELYMAIGDVPGCMAAAYPEPGKVLSPEEKQQQKVALASLFEAARAAFHLKPFDPQTGQGAMEADVEAALDALWRFLEKKA